MRSRGRIILGVAVVLGVVTAAWAVVTPVCWSNGSILSDAEVIATAAEELGLGSARDTYVIAHGDGVVVARIDNRLEQFSSLRWNRPWRPEMEEDYGGLFYMLYVRQFPPGGLVFLFFDRCGRFVGSRE